MIVMQKWNGKGLIINIVLLNIKVPYFTTSEKALKEVEEAGFKIVSYAGAEGFLSGISTDIKKLANGNKEIYENFINAAVETCELKQYRDATEHINIIVRR